MSHSPKTIATQWLSKFAESVSTGDVQSTVSAFLPHGFLRDFLIFSWNNRTLERHEKISSYLSNSLAPAQITNVQLDEQAGLEPELFPITPSITGVAAAFTFESCLFHGRGYFRLCPGESPGAWKALTVFTMADDLKGQEEVGRETGLYGAHTLSWEEVNAERRANIESDPQVVIIGAGQTGLQIAARFGQMKIRTIVVEANPRVGDNWRKRYPTLVLHTPRTHVNLLYQPFPKNWPTFTPRDKLANWLEQYAESQDIIVWTKSHIQPIPRYDDKAHRWDVIVDRNGTLVELRPAHIVVAAGTLGAPRTPDVDGYHEFLGEVFHASRFMGAQPYAGKRVIVVGGGTTAADICQDLSFRGAASVTMVVRNSTCVVSAKIVNGMMDAAFPEGVPTEISDFKTFAMPFPLMRATLIEQQEERLTHDKDLHDGLRNAGLKLNEGADGSGQLILVYEKLGGYWVDVGCGELVVSGKVQIKSGVELRHFSSNTVIFSDDSELAADVVIFATGYENIRDTMRKTFGDIVIDHTEKVWGLDDEGEFRGCFRPSGQPGLWFGAGDFWNSRFLSKLLAIQIKARELGLIPA